MPNIYICLSMCPSIRACTQLHLL